ncbi:MAG: hypothetical protein O9301_15935 [Leptospira sp.]|nr:hypothetical protein [Leptospira sp.]
MDENLKKAMADAIALINDESYFTEVTPSVDNHATKTKIEAWKSEIQNSVKNYPIENYLSDSFGQVQS